MKPQQASISETSEQQLRHACSSMARSWQEPSAKLRRKAMGAPGDARLGLIVQKMGTRYLGAENGSGTATGIDRETGAEAFSASFSFRNLGGKLQSASGIKQKLCGRTAWLA